MVPICVAHAFCLTPTDEDSHSATIVVLRFAIVCVCVCVCGLFNLQPLGAPAGSLFRTERRMLALNMLLV